MSDFLSNKWVQAILVMALFSIIKVTIAGILRVEHYPTGEFTMLIKSRDWARLVIICIYDAQMMVYGIFIARAMDWIKFV